MSSHGKKRMKAAFEIKVTCGLTFLSFLPEEQNNGGVGGIKGRGCCFAYGSVYIGMHHIRVHINTSEKNRGRSVAQSFFNFFLKQIPVMNCKRAACICIQYLISKAKIKGGKGGWRGLILTLNDRAIKTVRDDFETNLVGGGVEKKEFL